MEISSQPTDKLEAHYRDICLEQLHRKQHGEPLGTDEYLARMHDLNLDAHKRTVLTELERRKPVQRGHNGFRVS